MKPGPQTSIRLAGRLVSWKRSLVHVLSQASHLACRDVDAAPAHGGEARGRRRQRPRGLPHPSARLAVDRGARCTPPASESISVGIARGLVLHVREERLPRERLYTCDEAFLTGTVAEVTPVRAVDGKTIGAGRRGPLTQRIQERCFRLVRGFEPDTRGLLTMVRGYAPVP